MGRNLNLAILISGRGSNMAALIEACRAPGFPAKISVVISNRPDAAGLETARRAGIATEIVDHKKFPDKPAFEAALQKTLERYPADLVCLAGFMRILSARFIDRWPDKIVNIHPSLLPAYKGLDTHERVLADGAAETGCSVHLVTAEMDGGPVLVQKRVPVRPDDTAETLAARVLAQEHIAYPEAVRALAEGRIKIAGGRVEIS
jgi:phosphoribosylglycinamide formyltransferase-1